MRIRLLPVIRANGIEKGKKTLNIEQEIQKGIYLENIGINEYALTKKQALFILELCKKEKVGILGGDILELVNNEIKYTYSNWYCNRNENESELNFCFRSIDYAEQYIVNTMQNKNFYTTLVLTEN